MPDQTPAAPPLLKRWRPSTWVIAAVVIGLFAFFVADNLGLTSRASAESPRDWVDEFPIADFDNTTIDYGEIVYDGNTRDSIPPIHDPVFVPVAEATIDPLAPVLTVIVDGDARAYPLEILLWHEIVNDVVGGIPLLVSYCPLCNSGVVFDRRLDGEIVEFGNTGRIRHFDMVMYDIATESWWQQFSGEAIMGNLTGARLEPFPARVESVARFAERAPDGQLLVPNNPRARPYGRIRFPAPNVGNRYPLPDGVGPVDRVIVVGDQAWTLDLVREQGSITTADGLVISWQPGQAAIHDIRGQSRGADVGNVVVQRDGADVPHDMAFAFAFAAFVPDGTLHQ